MKFSRDQISALSIRKVEPGLIHFADRTFDTDVFVSADGVVGTFDLPDLASLREVHLQPLLSGNPELIILGTGWQPVFAPRDLVFALARRGIGLETMDTPAACRTYNILLSDARRLAAVIKIR
ncbi:MAG TPA: MTH938/NDUFAF3 family protein [Woeseiaceae bacterium]|nr:MTH938/NDUFAF3 family protein [Woeseiaceae bacterium]